MTTAIAAVLVGALWGAAAGAFASPVRQQTAELKGVPALVVPQNYRPTHFAAGTSAHTSAGKPLIVAGEHAAKLLAHSGDGVVAPVTPQVPVQAGSDGSDAGSSGGSQSDGSGTSAPPSQGDGKDAGSGNSDSGQPPKADKPPKTDKPPKADKPPKTPEPTSTPEPKKPKKP
jgi:hypothetical protein